MNATFPSAGPSTGAPPPNAGSGGKDNWTKLAMVGGVVLGLAGLAWLLWLLWLLLTEPDARQDRRVVQQITLVTPPPPPPPEPEEVIEEEQEVITPSEDPKVQEDVDKPSDEPNDQPADNSEAAGLDKPADTGSDSFRLSAGKGGGMFGRGGGGGGGGGDWGGFVETHIRRALQRDPRTRMAQGYLRVAVTISAAGQFAGAALRSSTGDPKLDAAVRDVLASLPPLGRGRPPQVNGLTNVTINMKRMAG